MMPKSTESKMCLKAIVDIDCASGEAVKAVYNKTINYLFERETEK